MGKSLNEMQKEIRDLQVLVSKCNGRLETDDTSHFDKFREVSGNVGSWISRNVSSNSGVKYSLAKIVQKSFSSGRIDQIVVGGILGAVAYGAVAGGSYAIDKISDSVAKRKAQELMNSYNEELAAKYAMLTDKLLQKLDEQEETIRTQGAKSDELEQEIQNIKDTIKVVRDSGYLKK